MKNTKRVVEFMETENISQKKKGFTLVELIIVITILAILATIAFISFQNYVKDARDGVRLSDLQNIEKGMALYNVKAGVYPEPDSFVSYIGNTGSMIKQGILGQNASNNIQMNKIPTDPLKKTEYVYSVFGNGRYYQLGAETEKQTANLFPTAYADSQSVIVRGNYKMDPSLPSLIVVPESASGKTLFDPNICFVVNGGSNTFSSSSGSCLKKNEMSLKSLDASLVGYWDMETVCKNGECGVGNDGKLKDLSGNGNYGTASGGVIVGTLNSVISKGTSFSGSQYFYINNSGSLDFQNDPFSLFAVFQPRGAGIHPDASVIVGKRQNQGYGLVYAPLERTIQDIQVSRTKGYLQCANSSCFGNNWLSNNQISQGNDSLYHSIGIVVDFKNKIYKFYQDGQSQDLKIDMGNIADIPSVSNKGYFSIGSWVNGNHQMAYPFNGIIDDIKIYNRALSDQEILQQAKIAGF